MAEAPRTTNAAEPLPSTERGLNNQALTPLAVFDVATVHGEHFRSLLQSSLPTERKVEEIAKRRENLGEQIAALPIAEGIKRVIQFLHALEETGAGLVTLSQIEKSDALDMRIPAVLLGVMLHKSHNSLNDESRLEVLEELFGERGIFSPADLSELLSNCQTVDAEVASKGGKTKLTYAVANAVINYLLRPAMATNGKIYIEEEDDDSDEPGRYKELNSPTTNILGLSHGTLDPRADQMLEVIDEIVPTAIEAARNAVKKELNISGGTTELEQFLRTHFKEKPDDIQREITEAAQARAQQKPITDNTRLISDGVTNKVNEATAEHPMSKPAETAAVAPDDIYKA